MTQESAITVNSVGFTYDDNPVFESISFRVPRGKMWALIGRSGVGKTTLLQIVAGLFHSPHGSVDVVGRTKESAGRIRGVVFQEDSLLGWLTVQQNLLFPQHQHPSKEALVRVKRILTDVGLTEFGSALPGTLSVGMRKRVEFARALLADDSYLLADEPFGPLDALTRRDLWRVWQSLRRCEPRTGILSTHDPEEAIRLCDVVVPLVPGPPAHLGEPIVIPPHLSALPSHKSNEELFALKERLISALGQNEGR